MADIYSLDSRGQKRKKHRKRLTRLFIFLIFIALIICAVLFIRSLLKPQVSIKQSAPIKTRVAYEQKTTTFNAVNFSIEIPKDWRQTPRPAGPYNSYTWQTSDSGTDGQVITIYEDTIPVNFAVNKVLIVHGENDHMTLQGTASDNCDKYTRGGIQAHPNQAGAPAKWQDVNFLCDQDNKQRDIIGTSSLDGVNTVILKGAVAGAHKYFFSYSSYNVANPDYAPFYSSLNTFRMK